MERLIRTIQGKNISKKTQKVEPKGEASARSLLRGLDKALTDSEVPDSLIKISGFHPSYSFSCKRRWVLLFQGAVPELKYDARTQRIFDNGHDVHARWRGYFRDILGILVDAEVEINISNPVPIRGHADGIINWGGHKLYELKSISPYRYEFRKMYKKADEKTYKQTQLYLHCLDLDEGFIIYENKGTQEVLIFAVERDEEFIKKLLTKYEKIYKIYEDGDTPARPYKRDSDHCLECPLETYCWDVLED